MTRQYRYIFFLLSSLFLLATTGCNREKTNFIFHENFISCYLGDDDYMKLGLKRENPYGIYIEFYFPIKIEKESFPEQFEQLAERNGDTSFNQWINHWRDPTDFGFETVTALADNFQSMHVTSDADWDEAHPAGAPLDDILQITMTTYSSFVRGGYQGYPDYGTRKSMLISELAPEDMEMIAPYPTIHFTSAPTISPNHTLTLEWTTVEGRVLKASLDCSEVTEALWREARQSD